MSNATILRRMFASFVRYSEGEIDLSALREAIVAHGYALEGTPREWRHLVDQVEGKLDIISYTVEEPAQSGAVSEQLDLLKEASRRMNLTGS